MQKEIFIYNSWILKTCIVEINTKRQILWFSRLESTNIRSFDWSFSKSLLKEIEILAFSCDRNNNIGGKWTSDVILKFDLKFNLKLASEASSGVLMEVHPS